MGQPFMSVFGAFVKALVAESPGTTGPAEVEMAWLSEFCRQVTAATVVGRFLEMWNVRETLPKGGSVRTLVRCRMCTPDRALPEDAQSINKLAHILRKVLLHRKGIEQEGPAPPTNNERKLHSQLEHRRKRVEVKDTWKKRSGLTSMRLTSQSRSGVSRMKTNDLLGTVFWTAWHLVALSVSRMSICPLFNGTSWVCLQQRAKCSSISDVHDAGSSPRSLFWHWLFFLHKAGFLPWSG